MEKQELILWLVSYWIFFGLKMMYFRHMKGSYLLALDWSWVPLDPMSYSFRNIVVNNWHPSMYVFRVIVYTGMGLFGVFVDILVWLIYLIDKRRFNV